MLPIVTSSETKKTNKDKLEIRWPIMLPIVTEAVIKITYIRQMKWTSLLIELDTKTN